MVKKYELCQNIICNQCKNHVVKSVFNNYSYICLHCNEEILKEETQLKNKPIKKETKLLFIEFLENN